MFSKLVYHEVCRCSGKYCSYVSFRFLDLVCERLIVIFREINNVSFYKIYAFYINYMPRKNCCSVEILEYFPAKISCNIIKYILNNYL